MIRAWVEVGGKRSEDRGRREEKGSDDMGSGSEDGNEVRVKGSVGERK